jgi:hypothetical protein
MGYCFGLLKDGGGGLEEVTIRIISTSRGFKTHLSIDPRRVNAKFLQSNSYSNTAEEMNELASYLNFCKVDKIFYY